MGAALLIVAASILGPRGARAQHAPVELWVRPLAAVPIGEFAGRATGVEAGPSLGFDAGGAVRVGGMALYAEFQQVDFHCGECEQAGVHDRVLDRGWEAGVWLPLGQRGRLRPWGRLGVVGHHLRFRFEQEEQFSDDSLGWGAGLGASLRILPAVGIEPALLVRSYDARFAFGIDVPEREMGVTYLGLGVAVEIDL